MTVASKTKYPILSGDTALQIDGGSEFAGALTQTNVDLGGGVRAFRLTGTPGGFIIASTAARTLAVGTDLWALFRLHVEAFPAGGNVMDLLAWRHNTNTYDSFAVAISSGTWRARYAGTTRTTAGLTTVDEQTITVLARLRQNSIVPTSEKEITVFISGQTTNWTFTFANSELYEYETLAIGSDTDRATLDIIAAACGSGTPDGSSNALSDSAAQALADDFTVLWSGGGAAALAGDATGAGVGTGDLSTAGGPPVLGGGASGTGAGAAAITVPPDDLGGGATGSGAGSGTLSGAVTTRTTEPLINNAGTPHLAVAVTWTWLPGWVIGSDPTGPLVHGSGTTHGTTGVFSCTTPTGAGVLEVRTADGGNYYQEFAS
jgi:hypothetical protein